jgi:ribonuclease P protein component
MGPNAFPKAARLLKSSEFQAVFDNVDKRFFADGFLALVRRNSLEQPRLGLVVAKKTISLSVKRNVCKRLIRESFRSHLQALQGLDVVILVRREQTQQLRHETWQTLNKLWQDIISAQNRF